MTISLLWRLFRFLRRFWPLAERLHVYLDHHMQKNVGDTLVVTAQPAPAGSTATNYVFTASDPALTLQSTADNVATFLCAAATAGATVSATAQAIDGTTVTGTSEAVVVAPVVATSLTLTLQ